MKSIKLLILIAFIHSENIYAQKYAGIDNTLGISRIKFVDNTSKFLYTSNKGIYGEIKTKIPAYLFKILLQQNSFQYDAIKDNVENSFNFKSNSILIGLTNIGQITDKIYFSGQVTIGVTWFSKGSMILRNNKFDNIEHNANFYLIYNTKVHFEIVKYFLVSIGLNLDYLAPFKKNSLIKNMKGTGLVFGIMYSIHKRKKNEFD